MLKKLLTDAVKAGYSHEFAAKYINFFGYNFKPKDIKLLLSRTRISTNSVHSGVDFSSIKRQERELHIAYKNYIESKTRLKEQLKRSTGSDHLTYTHW